MSSEAEKLLQKFVLMLEEKFDVKQKTSTNVLDLHLKGADSKEEANSLASMLKRVLKGDFGLYVLVSKEAGFWGPSESIISKLRSAYVEKWAMILLDGSPTIGHLYTPRTSPTPARLGPRTRQAKATRFTNLTWATIEDS